MEKIYIHKGDCTIFADCKKFLTFQIETGLDLTGWTAEFVLGDITKPIKDISSKSFDVVLSSKETSQLSYGKQNGSIVLVDNEGNTKTIVNTIPFEITSKVIENDYQLIDLTIPESSGVDIKLKVGTGYVTSVNGITGEVVLEIPSIDGLATEKQLADGLEGKQDKGEYAMLEDIPNMTDYVKNTDYATQSEGGVIKQSTAYGFSVNETTGVPFASTKGLAGYKNSDGNMFIGKNTLENIKDDYVKRGVTENTIELTDDEKTNARTWIGAVGDTDYASENVGGVVKISGNYFGLAFNGSKQLYVNKASDAEVTVKASHYKPIVPSNLDLAVKTGLTTNSLELTNDEKASVKQWLGYAEPTDIMQAIAAIPQFSLSIVEALPETGNKMTLYLVPKESTDKDVYDEYIWIEQTSTFEHLGTTAVDLTDYVKKTDYITGSTAGVVRAGAYYGTTAFNGFLCCQTRTQEQYDEHDNTTVIGKGTLENIKNDVVKRAITTNDIELTDDEKASARTWLGAISDTDYAGATTGAAGVVKCSSTFACGCTNGYIQALNIPTLERYNNLSQYAFIGKATLETALTQYSKTVLTTQDDYDALETKDENTLYLIEE